MAADKVTGETAGGVGSRRRRPISTWCRAGTAQRNHAGRPCWTTQAQSGSALSYQLGLALNGLLDALMEPASVGYGRSNLRNFASLGLRA